MLAQFTKNSLTTSKLGIYLELILTKLLEDNRLIKTFCCNWLVFFAIFVTTHLDKFTHKNIENYGN